MIHHPGTRPWPTTATYPAAQTGLALDACPNHRPGDTHQPDRDADLCRRCRDRYPQILRALAEAWEPLTGAVTTVKAFDFDAVRVDTSSISDAYNGFNLAASTTVRYIEDYTTVLLRTIARWNPAGCAVPDGTRTDVALVVIARTHSRWLTGFPTLGAEWAGEAQRLLDRARAASGPRATRYLQADTDVTCPAVIGELDTDAGPATITCGSSLKRLLSADGHTTVALVCSRDSRHRYDPKDWLTLAP